MRSTEFTRQFILLFVVAVCVSILCFAFGISAAEIFQGDCEVHSSKLHRIEYKLGLRESCIAVELQKQHKEKNIKK